MIDDDVRQLQRQIDDLRTLVNKAYRQEALDWTWLTTPLTSTSWDGDSLSTTAKTEIALATAFTGLPAGCKAIAVRVYCRDAASSGGVYWFSLSPNNTADSHAGVAWADRQTNDRFGEADFICPCSATGNVYYQCAASGAGTLDVWIEIVGYCR